MSQVIKSPKKLIEVALPLDAINAAAGREKSIRHGHPSTLHIWWARRPLAAARAVIFGQMVNDPSWKWEMEHPGEIPPNSLKASWAASRKRLFSILEDLVKWTNITNEEVLERARIEIRKSWRETCELNSQHPRASKIFNPDKLPGLHDPFAGGGAIPLEAQRLGLEPYASDLNPVAVLINKAMIEFPPKFSGTAPVNPDWQTLPKAETVLREWRGAEGLANDVEFYGKWLREQAEGRIGRLYPKIEITPEMASDRPDLKPLLGQKLTVIAWIWARTVKSSNPAFKNVDVPLATTFMLFSKSGKEAYVEPVIENGGYRFTVKVGIPPNTVEVDKGTKLARGANFRCIMSGSPIGEDHIRSEFKAKRAGERLMAIVAESEFGRIYLAPTREHESAGKQMKAEWKPELEMNQESKDLLSGRGYGFKYWHELFTNRQLVTLTTLSDLVKEATERANRDALAASNSLPRGQLSPAEVARAKAYAEAIGVYLAIAVSKETVFMTTQARWRAGEGKSAPAFGRQALPMVWDYAEVNPFAGAGGDFNGVIDGTVRMLRNSPNPLVGCAVQADAATQNLTENRVVSTDPPYYDNIAYADLSDFFYIWLRRILQPAFPKLFATMAVPKEEELVASLHRHGSNEKAEAFFLAGMTQAMQRLAEQAHPAFPVTIYYAFKQSETETDVGTVSKGWVTFLEAVFRAGFAVSGTWPIRTENQTRLVGMVTNALASSIVLVCRPRPLDAPTTSQRAFLNELNQTLPEAMDEMTRGSGDERSPVAPVDLSQAILGPGMAIFSKYAAVLEADGTRMSAEKALRLINRFLTEDDFDHTTQFCLHWFEQHGWQDGKFGEADTLARAKGTSVDGVKRSGVLSAAGGVVSLVKWADYPPNFEPVRESRVPTWEALHQVIRLFRSAGETGAGTILAALQTKSETIRQLAYRLYTLCERSGWAEDARAYNEIITSWSAIESAATAAPKPKQSALFEV